MLGISWLIVAIFVTLTMSDVRPPDLPQAVSAIAAGGAYLLLVISLAFITLRRPGHAVVALGTAVAWHGWLLSSSENRQTRCAVRPSTPRAFLVPGLGLLVSSRRWYPVWVCVAC